MSSLCGPEMFGKPLLEHRDDFGGVVDRQRRLGHEGEIVGILRREGRGVVRGLDQRHRARRQLPECADHFRMMGMPDQQDLAAALEMDRRLAVHLGDQRTGGVEREEIAGPGVGRNRFWHPVGRKHHRGVGIVRDFSQFLDENRALGLAGCRPHSGYGRSHGGHRPGRRKSLTPARRCRSPAPRRRRSPAASKARFSGVVWLAWGRSRTESPLEGGRGTVNSDNDLGRLLGAVKAG